MNWENGRIPPSYVPTLTEVVAVPAGGTAAPAHEGRDATLAPLAGPSVAQAAPAPMAVDIDTVVARLQQDLARQLEEELRRLAAAWVEQAVGNALEQAKPLLNKALRDVVVQQSAQVPDSGAN
ncbi:hypothetical protein [Hydrogenophaga aquatica]